MAGLDTSTLPLDLLLNILNIILLFLIVRSLVYKPVKKIMAQRREKIDAASKAAQEKSDEADKIKNEYESKIAVFDEQSKMIVLEGQEKARKQASEILDEAHRQSNDIITDARKLAESERKAMLGSLQNDVASLAVDISEKILSREINDEDNKKIAEDFFKDGDLK